MSTAYTKLSAISDLSGFTSLSVKTTDIANKNIVFSKSLQNFRQFNDISIEISRTVGTKIYSSQMCLSTLTNFLSACIYDETHAPYIRLSNETRNITLNSNGTGWTSTKLGDFLTKNDSREDSSFLRVDGKDLGGNLPYIRLINENRTIQSTHNLTIKANNIELSGTNGVSLSCVTSNLKLKSSDNACLLSTNAYILLVSNGGRSSGIVLSSNGSNNDGIKLITNDMTNSGIILDAKGQNNRGINITTTGAGNQGMAILTQNTATNFGISLTHIGDSGNITLKSLSTTATDDPGIVLKTEKAPILFNSGQKPVNVVNTFNATKNDTAINTILCTATAAIWN